jgi:formylglycine-generating enzyme required for sulfatase activity
VGYFKVANAFGLYDMHGNVWEWCEDDYHPNYQGAPTDGSAWISKNKFTTKVLRGGSWGGYPNLCRSAYRYAYFRRDNRYNYYGFRVVCGAGGTVIQ